MNILGGCRAAAARREDDRVVVTLSDGREITGSHCLMAVGGVPNTKGIGLEEAGVTLTKSGHIEVDRVSRTWAFRIYAAGDCTGVYPLASVAAMQGRIAMWHAFGDAVKPLNTRLVAANIFTAPEIATIVITQMDALGVGVCAWRLGAGRARKEEPVQAGAGVEILVPKGSPVQAGQPILRLHTDTPEVFDFAIDALEGAIEIGDAASAPANSSVVLERID